MIKKGNIGNTDLRQPCAPVANNQAATLALSHLPLLHHGLALKHALIMLIVEISLIVGCVQNPICTKSHKWEFVHLYGIVFVIIVIIIMIIKSEGVNAQL